MLLLRQYRAWQNEMRLLNGDRWQDTGYVFTRDDGLPMAPDSIGAWLTDFSARHELPHINPHAFRHTVASVLINNGTDVVAVSKRLGHAKTSTTTDIYAHIIQEADEQASECIADVMLRRKKG
jgi:integrase